MARNSLIPHRRLNPLTGEWILVSPHRTLRPWQGRVEHAAVGTLLKYDPNCYLCPGNVRANGEPNPEYSNTFVFENDFPALLPQSDHESEPEISVSDDLLHHEMVTGRCRVICFSPRHDLTIPLMQVQDLCAVVEAWVTETRLLSGNPNIAYVQIFENKGELMGCSNPHPHCQVWASSFLPNQPALEDYHQREYRLKHGSCLLCDYERLELQYCERIVCRNEHWLAVTPFWAIWPYETMLLATRHCGSFLDLTADEKQALAEILHRLTTRYDNLFMTSFPYSMGFHQQPVQAGDHDHWHFHAHFYPPLLRSATVRKFMVGYEMLGSPQRDITAETAAELLRGASETHFSLGT